MARITATLGGTTAAERVREIWDEYEEGQSPESMYVRSLDKLECALQAYEYEATRGGRLDEFIVSAEQYIQHPRLLAILEAIKRRRDTGPLEQARASE